MVRSLQPDAIVFDDPIAIMTRLTGEAPMKFVFGKFTIETRGEPAVGGGFKGVARWWWDEDGATLTRDTVFETVQATAADADIHAAAQMRIRAEAGML